MLLGEGESPLAYLVGEQQLATGRGDDLGQGELRRPLVGHGEVADLLDGVAEEVDPDRVLLGGREDVHDPAADGELAPPLDHVHPDVRRPDQRLGQLFEIDVLAHHQAHGGHVAQPLHLRLQHAADRGDDDLRRGQLVVAHHAPQHGQPTADRVRSRTEPLVRQRLPGRVVGDVVLPHQRAAGGGHRLRLPVGGGDQQHRPARPALVGRGGQGGRDQRAHGRRRGQVEGREGTRTCVTDSLGDDRVGGEQLDESRQGHGRSLSGVQEGSGATLFPSSPIQTNEREPAEPVTTERGARQTDKVTGTPYSRREAPAFS
jgi:hypothetical protein